MAGYFDKKAFTKAAEPLITSLGLILWGVDYLPAGKKSVLRVYVDAPADDGGVPDDGEQPQGVLLDQCAQVSRHLSVLLDAEDLVPGAYNLEVSSPGLSRPFFRVEQMAGYVGREVDVSLRDPLIECNNPGRKRFSGLLEDIATDKGTFTLTADDETLVFTWDQVKKVRLVHHFPDTSVRKGGKRK